MQLLNGWVHQLDSTTPPRIREPLDRGHIDTIDDFRCADSILEVDTEGSDTALAIGDTIDDRVLESEVQDLTQTDLTTTGSTRLEVHDEDALLTDIFDREDILVGLGGGELDIDSLLPTLYGADEVRQIQVTVGTCRRRTVNLWCPCEGVEAVSEPPMP